MQLPFVVIGCFLIGRRTEVPRKIVKCNWRKVPFPGRVGSLEFIRSRDTPGS